MVEKLNEKKKLQCIFNAIKSSSNLGKQQVVNGERERDGKEKKNTIQSKN